MPKPARIMRTHEPTLLSDPPTSPTESPPQTADASVHAHRGRPTPPSTRPDDGQWTCARCSVRFPAAEATLRGGHSLCPGCAAALNREIAARRVTPAWGTAVLGGLGGAFVGALLWAAIALVTDLEVGYVAVLVGLLAGLGVRIGARRAPSQALQVLAAGMALVGLVVAKYLIIAWIASRELGLSPFDPIIASMFVEVFGELLSPFDLLWVFLAVGAAYRVPAAATAET